MILFRHIVKEVLTASFGVSFSLLIIVISSRLVSYLADAAEGDISANLLLSIILLKTPSFLELVLPMGFFLGVLLAFDKMYVDSEMSVMHACGVSQRKLLAYLSVPTLLVMALVAMLTLYISPLSNTQVKTLIQQERARSDNLVKSLVEGRFRYSKDGTQVTYIESVDGAVLSQVFSASTKGQPAGQYTLLVAQEGSFKHTEQENEAGYLILEDGWRIIGSPGFANYELSSFGELVQRQERPDKASAIYVEAEMIPTLELLSTPHPKYRANLEWRFSIPLLVPIVAIIAFSLSRTNPRRGRYTKLLPAFLIYFVYLVVLNYAKQQLEKGDLPPVYGMLSVHVLFFMLAVFLLFRRSLLNRLRAK